MVVVASVVVVANVVVVESGIEVVVDSEIAGVVVTAAVSREEQALSTRPVPTSRAPTATTWCIFIVETITVCWPLPVPLRRDRSRSGDGERLTEETFGYCGTDPDQGDVPRR